ncbi:MAG TPA: CapA family protein [Polyangiaceae bacterium]
MRPASILLGVWLGACASAPARDLEPVPHAVVAAAIPAIPAVHAPAAPVRVLVGGDVIPHRPQLVDAASITAGLAPLATLFAEADAAVVNYETATGDISGIDSSTLSLAAKPDWMHAVVSSNVTALTLANNHACDLGRRGLAASVDTAASIGVTALGASAGDPWEAKTIAMQGSRRLCAVAWTTFVNDHRPGCMTAGRLAIAPPTHEGRLRVARAIARAFHDGCDAVVAIVHGGQEYAPQTGAMLSLANAAADAGADAVIIHHPHVVSPVVIHATEDGRKVPIFASLGNLVSNQGESWTPDYPAAQNDRHIVYLNGWTRLGMLADLSFQLDTKGPQKLAAWGYRLVFVDSDHVLDKSNPHPHIATRLLDSDKDRAVIDKLARDADGPRAVFDDPCRIEDSAALPACRP